MLGQRRDIGVVVDEHRQVEPVAHQVAESGTSTSGRFTALIAWPRSRSIVHGMPRPAATASGQRLEGLAQFGLERVENLVGAAAKAALFGAVQNGRASGDNAHKHLRAAQVGADRRGARLWGRFSGHQRVFLVNGSFVH